MDAIHPQRELQQPEQRSPALADQQKQSSPPPQQSGTVQSQEQQQHVKVKLREINSYLTCHLCKGYLIDATTISECLHSFCRSCIIKFLEDNSFCPVCEVIINKAKPNLKLDKTLQDIVYKLVPGLFLAEMLRRKRFYSERPGEAERVSPEQRGEDTERTIFNPQDRISLSLEYIGDAATSGRILKGLKTTLKKEQEESNSKDDQTEDVQTESLLKRYLQCPAMCRIDVIKKFIRNKYSVNTELFQIDILYKRVPLPLPAHYTLIDVAYIYTWKRNEPMRFYFRIIEKGNDEMPDLTKVFTPIDGPPLLRHQARSTPAKKITKASGTPEKKDRKRKTPKKKLPSSKLAKKEEYNGCDKKTIKTEFESEVKKSPIKQYGGDKLVDELDESSANSKGSAVAKNEIVPVVGAVKTDPVEAGDVKKEVYTNITLNRTNNIEIITKIHKVSDKDGQPIGVNIVNQTVKKIGGAQSNDSPKNPTSANGSNPKLEIKEPEALAVKQEVLTVKEEVQPVLKRETEETPRLGLSGLTDDELEQKKFEFLKSIELTSKKVVDNLAKLMQKQQAAKALNNSTQCSQNKSNVSGTGSKPCYPLKAPMPNATMEIVKTKRINTPKPGVKRKNVSPVKNDFKKTKLEPKRTTKIIIQQKPGYPTVNPIKLNESTKSGESKNDLHSLFQNCRLNIPSSLSITLKENGEMSRKPLQIPPVQNYIEILKIDEKEGKKTITLKRDDNFSRNLGDMKKLPEVEHKIAESSGATGNDGAQLHKTVQTLPKIENNEVVESGVKLKENKDVPKMTKQQQSFQKIFEESIKKTETESLPTDIMNSSSKRNILEIAQQLYKKTKIEQDSKKNQMKPEAAAFRSVPVTPKIPIPRLSNQRVVKPPKRNQKYDNLPHQTLTNLHSSSLGLNYTVSVGKQTRDPVQQTYTVNGIMTSPTSTNCELNSKTSSVKNRPEAEQSAAKPCYSSTPSPVNSAPISPKTLDTKHHDRSPQKNCKIPHSPRPNIASPAPKSELVSLPSPKNYTSRNYAAKTPQSSPKPRSSNASPKLAQSAGPSSVPTPSSPSLTPNQLLEKYNIQNLAQLSASMNFNAAAVPQSYLSAVQGNQMAALHQAMLMKQFEMQSRQKWLNINQGPLLQFEKYLQSLNASKNQILGNIKDN